MKISISGLMAGLIAIVIGCALLAVAWEAYVDDNRLKAYGGRTTAFITKKYSRPAADGLV